jgi:hypothetical protein
MNEIFISYRRDDAGDITGRIHDRLRKHFGVEAVFMDVHKIPLGVDFRIFLDEKLSQCKVLLAVMGRKWLTAKDDQGRPRLEDPGDLVRIEIESALRCKIPVIPLLVDRAEMPSAEKLPESLQPLVFQNGVLIRPDPDFDNDMERLFHGLEQHFPYAAVANDTTPEWKSTPLEKIGHGDHYKAIAKALTLILIVCELLALGIFSVFEAEAVKLGSVIVPNLLGLSLMAIGAIRRVPAEVALGITAGGCPWLFILFMEPAATVVITVLAVLLLGFIVLKL